MFHVKKCDVHALLKTLTVLQSYLKHAYGEYQDLQTPILVKILYQQVGSYSTTNMVSTVVTV